MNIKESVGIVKWFGGYNTKTYKENNFGFIESIEGEDIYVNKRDIDHENKSLDANDFVIFNIEDESSRTLARNVKKVDINSKSKEFSKRIIKYLALTDNYKSEFIIKPSLQQFLNQFPDILDFHEIEYSELIALISIQPENQTIQILDKYLSTKNVISEDHAKSSWLKLFKRFNKYQTVSININTKEIYDNLSDDDWDVARLWLNEAEKENNFELARMISARGAEKAAKIYYESLGFSVIDTAITQNDLYTNQNSTAEWKLFDLHLDEKIGIDVKNARPPINSNFYNEHCVPRFKEDRHKEEVIITGVVSPYIQLLLYEDRKQPEITIPSKSYLSDDYITILGEISFSKINTLEHEFSDPNFSIVPSQINKHFIPEWMFEFSSTFYLDRNNILEEFKKLSKQSHPSYKECEILEIYPIPIYLLLGIKLSTEWENTLKPWQIAFYNNLSNKVNLDTKISLPFLYLSILKHFHYMLTNESDNISYDPNEYKQLLYVDDSIDRPLGIFDMKYIINTFIEDLSRLWSSPAKSKIKNFISFRFDRKGLLQGKELLTDRQYTTIMAYCGGFIPKKGTCGKKPLLIGIEKTCSHCLKLICSSCDFCSKNCQRINNRDKIIEFLKSEKKDLETNNPQLGDSQISEILLNRTYTPASGKSWSLKSLNNEFISKEVFL